MPSDHPDIVFQPLASPDSLQEALARSDDEPVVIFKHSTMCGISSMARRRLMQLNLDDDPPVYELTIQTSRGLSSELAGLLGIQHQSPQVILIYRRKAVYHTSHSMISAENVRNALIQAFSS